MGLFRKSRERHEVHDPFEGVEPLPAPTTLDDIARQMADNLLAVDTDLDAYNAYNNAALAWAWSHADPTLYPNLQRVVLDTEFARCGKRYTAANPDADADLFLLKMRTLTFEMVKNTTDRQARHNDLHTYFARDTAKILDRLHRELVSRGA